MFSIRVGFDNKNGHKRSEIFLVHLAGFSVVSKFCRNNYPENQQVLEKQKIEGNSKSRYMFRSFLLLISLNLIVSLLSEDENKLKRNMLKC